MGKTGDAPKLQFYQGNRETLKSCQIMSNSIHIDFDRGNQQGWSLWSPGSKTSIPCGLEISSDNAETHVKTRVRKAAPNNFLFLTISSGISTEKPLLYVNWDA